MKLTVNIKEQNKIAAFLNLIKKMDYVEIVDVKVDSEALSVEHRDLLDDRLLRIENEETTFKNWDVIKKKYESKEISICDLLSNRNVNNKNCCDFPHKQKS